MIRINFKFEQPGIKPIVISGIEPGYNLLEIALQNNINLHHKCGGVCACSSCHLYINKGGVHLQEISEKEKDFIERAIVPQDHSRLGCQCLLVKDGGNIEVTIPDQTHVPD